MTWGMGGHQAGFSTLRVPSLCSQGATGCQSRKLWGETSLPGSAEAVVWWGTSVSPVCHQRVTVPDHCQVPGCIWDLTQPWEPKGCGWAQGADSSPGAQGGTRWRSLSSRNVITVPLQHSSAPAQLAGSRRVCVPKVTRCCGDLVGPRPIPLMQDSVPLAAGLCLRGASWPVLRWGQCHHP